MRNTEVAIPLPNTVIRIRRFALITRNPSQATISRVRSLRSARELRVSGPANAYTFESLNPQVARLHPVTSDRSPPELEGLP